MTPLGVIAIQRTTVWGKPFLDPADMDIVTVGDLVRFIKKSHRITRITTIHLYLSKLYLKHYWFHFFPDTVYI